ncbi:Tyrosinase [Mycena sanguinolenta]|uniref:tyrosinase n=1 Tax=Mycena sanguinolenta TaxID=230812 RepID=A0A8H7D469_9AGAR|nr:Tyrosinase [Mycena sanguinolenta]
MSSKYIISGAKGGTPPPGAPAPNRMEIHDFVKVADQFSLYIQALQHIYNESQGDVASFFSIGGIHGLPYQVWDGERGAARRPKWVGGLLHTRQRVVPYLAPALHGSVRALQTAAIAIAATYKVDAARFQQAALVLRQPYWDWASNSVPPPEVISLDKVSIIGADGKTVQVANPLRRYTFHPIDPSFPEPYSSWKTTLRQPDTTDPNATDDVRMLTRVLQSVQSQLKSKTYNLLTRVHTWPAFSNHTPGDGGSTSNSLEAIHDGVHVDVGGNGQMSDPSVAAFDPIFFLHHANVDRLLSLWSALNPGVWVTPGEATGGTFTITPDSNVDKNSDLTPFWNAQNTYWHSTGVTTTAALGYTYPEFNGLNLGNPTAVRTAIAQKVNQLYGPNSTSKSIQSKAASVVPQSAPHIQANLAHVPAPAAHNPAPAPVAAVSAPHNNPNPGHSAPHTEPDFSHVPMHQTAGEHRVWDWTARIQIKKYEVGGSFMVLLFLGSVPDDPKEWRFSPNFVGAHNVFANSVPDRCANCRTHRDAVVEGFVHLTEGITEHSGLHSLEPDVVVPYLKHDLHWRVQKAGGEPVNLTDVPSLEVAVFATPLTFPPEADFPAILQRTPPSPRDAAVFFAPRQYPYAGSTASEHGRTDDGLPFCPTDHKGETAPHPFSQHIFGSPRRLPGPAPRALIQHGVKQVLLSSIASADLCPVTQPPFAGDCGPDLDLEIAEDLALKDKGDYSRPMTSRTQLFSRTPPPPRLYSSLRGNLLTPEAPLARTDDGLPPLPHEMAPAPVLGNTSYSKSPLRLLGPASPGAWIQHGATQAPLPNIASAVLRAEAAACVAPCGIFAGGRGPDVDLDVLVLNAVDSLTDKNEYSCLTTSCTQLFPYVFLPNTITSAIIPVPAPSACGTQRPCRSLLFNLARFPILDARPEREAAQLLWIEIDDASDGEDGCHVSMEKAPSDPEMSSPRVPSPSFLRLTSLA